MASGKRSGQSRPSATPVPTAFDLVHAERGLYTRSLAQRRSDFLRGMCRRRSWMLMTSLMSWSQPLTDNRHAGELYELTGPRSLSFAEVAAEIAEATGRDIGTCRSHSKSMPRTPQRRTSPRLGGGVADEACSPADWVVQRQQTVGSPCV